MSHPHTMSHPQNMRELKTRLDSLQQKKTELLTEIADVDTKIKRVKAEYGRAMNCSAGIYRLPNEILCDIFELGKTRKLGSIRRYSKVEMRVSHVSSHWRAVALGYPALWSDIHGRIDDIDEIDDMPSTTLEKLEAYLERSKGHPLNIDFTFFSSPPRSMAIIPSISAHIDRWRKVTLRIFCLPICLMIFESIRNRSAPLLQHFSLGLFGHPPADADYPQGQIFTGGAPNLKLLGLSGSAFAILQPPLGGLTTLLLAEPDMDWFMTYTRFNSIINSSPSLENLSVDGKIITEWPTGHRTIPIPSLHSLRVEGTAGFFYTLTSAIAAPYLDSLVVAKCTNDATPHPVPLLRSSEMPKFPRLRTLTIRGGYLTSQASRNIFHTFPTITHFTLLGQFGVETLKALGGDWTQPSELPLPRLHTLTMEALEAEQDSMLCSTVLCSTVLVKRKQLGRPITTLRLESPLKKKLERTGTLERLEQVVEVVEWSGIGAWPPGTDCIIDDGSFGE